MARRSKFFLVLLDLTVSTLGQTACSPACGVGFICVCNGRRSRRRAAEDVEQHRSHHKRGQAAGVSASNHESWKGGRRLFGASPTTCACTPAPPPPPSPPPPLPPPPPSPPPPLPPAPPRPPPPPTHCTSCCWSNAGAAGALVTIRTNGAPTHRVWLSTNSDGSNVDLWSETTGNQQWRIYNYGTYANIRTNGAPIERVWLSTNSDGSNVDMWSATTGNQQWIIYDMGTYAYIRVSPNGAPIERVWLSTNVDGSNVDLWSATTGNQQWTIACI
jgi:hypothetical protein